MFALPAHLSRLKFPEFCGNRLCYVFDCVNQVLYSIKRNHQGKDGEDCIVKQTPINIKKAAVIDYWFSHQIVNQHIILTDYDGLKVYDSNLNQLGSINRTHEMIDNNFVYGCNFDLNKLKYWVVENGLVYDQPIHGQAVHVLIYS